VKALIAFFCFVFTFVGVAVVTGIMIAIVFEPEPNMPGPIAGLIPFHFGLIWRTRMGEVLVGIGAEWWNLLGTISGFLAGVQSWRVAMGR
jgi:hypothetical protein